MDLKKCCLLVTPTSYGKNDSRLKPELEALVGEVIYNPTGKPLTSAEVGGVQPGIDGHIAGFGVIGKQLVRRLSGFYCRVMAYDPFADPVFASNNQVELATLQAVVEQADFLSLHLPKLITTPHLGVKTDGDTSNMGWFAMRDCLAVLRNEQPIYRVV